MTQNGDSGTLLGRLVTLVPDVPVRDARWVHLICNPVIPLDGADREKMFQDLQPVRGGGRFDILEQAIRWAAPGNYEKHFVTGHSGSGKSTELLRLASELQKEKDGKSFHVVYMDASLYLDMGDVQLPELLAAFLPALLDDPVLKVASTATAPVLWRRIRDWVTTIGPEVFEDLTRGIPVLRTLFKQQPGFQKRFREKANEQLSSMIRDMGDLFQEIRNNLLKQHIDDFVVIADNLEKIHLRTLDHDDRKTNHDLFFCDQLPAIQELPVHMILTLPLALHVSQARMRLQWSASRRIMVPMVHVRKRGDTAEDQDGIDAMRKLLALRVDLKTAFTSDDLVRRLIVASGGCTRDLLRLVDYSALISVQLPIGRDAVESAIAQEVNDLERVLQGKPFLPQLHEIDREGVLPAGLDEGWKQWLLHNLIVIEYNGNTWFAVHPFARATRAYEMAAPQPRKE